MAKKKDEVTAVDAGDALLHAIDILRYIEAVSVSKQDTETMFNVAAMWIDIFGRLTESGEVVTGLSKTGHMKYVGFTPPEIPKGPGKDD